MNSVGTTSLGRQLAKHFGCEYLTDSSVYQQRLKEISFLGAASPKKNTKWNHIFARKQFSLLRYCQVSL